MRELVIPDIGLVKIYKRRRMRNIRIAVLPSGQVRVNMPRWATYRAAQHFVKKQAGWINQQRLLRTRVKILDGHRIGPMARVSFIRSSHRWPKSFVSVSKVVVSSSLDFEDERFQAKAHAASEKSLWLQAEKILSLRVGQVASRHGLKYRSLRIKKLSSRWGSCSADGVITLSFFLIQLPSNLIDYVIIHELIHTEHMNHGQDFWQRFEKILPSAKALRRQIRAYQPLLKPRPQDHLQTVVSFDSIDIHRLPLG